MGVRAFKIEAAREPAYVAQVTKVWREAIDALQRRATCMRPKPPGCGHSLPSGRATARAGFYHRPGSDGRDGSADDEAGPGPLQYYWPRETVFEFTRLLAQTRWTSSAWARPCARAATNCAERLDGHRAHAAGCRQEDNHVTMVLLESAATLADMHKIARIEVPVEANDMGAVHGNLADKRPSSPARSSTSSTPTPLAGWPAWAPCRWCYR